MTLSNTVENTILQDFVTRYPTLYLAFSTADPGEDGSTIAEPVGNGYIRQLTGDVTIIGSILSNDDPIIFPISTGSWGTITHVALFTDESGGAFLGSGAITPVLIEVNTIITILSDMPILTMN